MKRKSRLAIVTERNCVVEISEARFVKFVLGRRTCSFTQILPGDTVQLNWGLPKVFVPAGYCMVSFMRGTRRIFFVVRPMKEGKLGKMMVVRTLCYLTKAESLPTIVSKGKLLALFGGYSIELEKCVPYGVVANPNMNPLRVSIKSVKIGGGHV